MKQWLRDNPTIAFGLGLPVLLVLVFLAISGLPTLLVAPPQHELLYSSNYNAYNNPQNGVQIAVVGGRVQVQYLGSTQAYQQPRLWRFNPKTGAVREISIPLPSGLSAHTGQPTPADKPLVVSPISVPELDTLQVDASSLAPDGYRFSTDSADYGSTPLRGLFYANSYRSQAELVKDGRSLRLPHTEGSYYGNSVRFIGWVVAP